MTQFSISLLFFIAVASAATINVSTSSQLKSACESASAGDTIVLSAGTFSFSGVTKIRCNAVGSAGSRITVKGSGTLSSIVEFDSSSGYVEGFLVQGAFWTFDNIVFRGRCSTHDYCEHALHVQGAAHNFQLLNSKLYDFNSQIKSNIGGGTWGNGGVHPNDGLIEGCEFYHSSVRSTGTPCNMINIDGGFRWAVRRNYIHDGGCNKVSYQAFMKSGAEDGVFERNLVRCKHNHGGGSSRVGLSFGGGGTGPNNVCGRGTCSVEHYRGVMRNNLIMDCDVGVYLNEASDSKILNNLLYNGGDIQFRFGPSSGEARNNLFIGGGIVRDRDGGSSSEGNNVAWSTSQAAAVFTNPSNADFARKTGASFSALVGKGVARSQVANDFCGNQRDGANDVGPFDISQPGCLTTGIPPGNGGSNPAPTETTKASTTKTSAPTAAPTPTGDQFPAAIERRARDGLFDGQVDARFKEDGDKVFIEVKNGLPMSITVELTVNPVSGGLTLGGSSIPQVKQVVVDASSGGYREFMRWDRNQFYWRWSWRYGFGGAQVKAPFGIPWRQSQRVNQGFFGSFSHNNEQNFHAIDVNMPRGTPILAARRGIVTEVIEDQPDNTKTANLIRVIHNDGSLASYLHLDRNGALVSMGEMVSEGQHIGVCGNSGFSTEPHLHFTVAAPNGVDTVYKTVPWVFRPDVVPKQGQFYGGAVATTARPTTRRPTTRRPTTVRPTTVRGTTQAVATTVAPTTPTPATTTAAPVTTVPSGTSAPPVNVYVNTPAELVAAIKNAIPGRRIRLRKKTYSFNDISEIRCAANGLAGKHIFIIGAGKQESLITFSSSGSLVKGFRVSGARWTFSNLRIEGKCSNHDHCDSAITVDDSGDRLTFLNSKVSGFNTAVRSNGAEFGRIELVNFDNGAAVRNTGRACSHVELIGGQRWVVRRNIFKDSSRAKGSRVSFGVVFRGGIRTSFFDQNQVVCSERHTTGYRVGVSAGGLSHKAPEADNIYFRNNLILKCNDVGFYISHSTRARLFNNLLYSTAGVDFRHQGTTGLLLNNLIAGGRVRNRDGGMHSGTPNVITSTSVAKSIFRNPDGGDFSLLPGADTSLFADKGRSLSAVKRDFCGVLRQSTTDIGPIDYAFQPTCNTRAIPPRSAAAPTAVRSNTNVVANGRPVVRTQAEGPPPVALIAGMVGAIVVVAAIIAAVVIVKRRRARMEINHNGVQESFLGSEETPTFTEV